MHLEVPIASFLDELASKASTPGGGSVAALSGALGAALISMVCNLTIGKEKYRGVEDEVKRILADSERLRHEMSQQIEADSRVLGELMAAYGLPRNTEEEKQKRAGLLQERSKAAIEVPLRVARGCAQIMDLSTRAVEVGSTMAISDVGVAVLLADSGLHSAILNVQINLPVLKDKDFAQRIQEEIDGLLAGKAELREEVVKKVEAKL